MSHKSVLEPPDKVEDKSNKTGRFVVEIPYNTATIVISGDGLLYLDIMQPSKPKEQGK
jgi:hypothetical protein